MERGNRDPEKSETLREHELKFALTAVFLLLAACNQFIQVEQSSKQELSSDSVIMGKCAYNFDPIGRIVSWGPSWPVKFYFDRTVPEKFQNAIKDSVAVWKTTDLKPLVQFATETVNSAASAADGKNIIYWITGSDMFKPGEQARTITRWKNGRIFDSDIWVNGKDFSFFIEKAQAQNELHLQSLLIHEFGHALGLKHISTFQSVMFQNLAYLQVRDMLTEEDVTNLRCQYP